ncbi:germinal-center associated nuclear protein [Venturia canescens]|uniref:germinal-center associated nuclear protein n=1 Tax=Venturia canescens TaxID=32260 RepID=UPI001C9D0248|nr:germinal-center associated nuclear protein [Venturia canescens]
MTEMLQGACFGMCSEKERWLREREGLLHILEIDDRTKHLRRPKADPAKTVKCYSRPSAGKSMTDISELRPAPVLLMTIRYLFKNVATRADINWALVYEFIFDRLRAIRQDAVIQRLNIPISIELYEPIVKFHIYAGERMCDRPLEEYVPKFNDQHLLECIKHLLVLYDERERIPEEKHNLQDHMACLSINDKRAQIEALYILLYLGDATALQRGLLLPKKYRESKEVKNAMEISLAWYLNNYVRVCKLIGKLEPIFACAALRNLPSIRRNALRIMSSGYNSQSLTFPGLRLQEILLYRDISKIENDCKLFGLTFTREKNVQFQKSKFNENELLANVEKQFKFEALHKLLPEILLE